MECSCCRCSREGGGGGGEATAAVMEEWAGDRWAKMNGPTTSIAILASPIVDALNPSIPFNLVARLNLPSSTP